MYWGDESRGVKSLRDDNGHRAKGHEQTDRGVSHLCLDHAAYGLGSLDEYWNNELCNHFLVFAFRDAEVSKTVTHDDADIFKSPMAEDWAFWYDSYWGWTPLVASDNFLMVKSFDNTDNMLRSVASASECADASSWVKSSTLPWMVPTIPQYEVALCEWLEYEIDEPDNNYQNPIGIAVNVVDRGDMFDGALLSSSCLKESGEGLVLTCKTLNGGGFCPVYMGTWADSPRFFEYLWQYDELNTYFNHVPISMADNSFHIWENTFYSDFYFCDLWDMWNGKMNNGNKDLWSIWYDEETTLSAENKKKKDKLKAVKNSELKISPPRKFRPCIAY